MKRGSVSSQWLNCSRWPATLCGDEERMKEGWKKDEGKMTG